MSVVPPQTGRFSQLAGQRRVPGDGGSCLRRQTPCQAAPSLGARSGVRTPAPERRRDNARVGDAGPCQAARSSTTKLLALRASIPEAFATRPNSFTMLIACAWLLGNYSPGKPCFHERLPGSSAQGACRCGRTELQAMREGIACGWVAGSSPSEAQWRSTAACSRTRPA